MIEKITNQVYTAIDRNKSFSIRFNRLRKNWKESDSSGKQIYVVPSDLCLIRIEQAFTKKLSSLRSYYRLEVESKFPGSNFDVSLVDDTVYVAIHRDSKALDYSHIELEPFALARVLSIIADEGIIIDIGRSKTTFVQVERGLLRSYRVVGEGVDFLARLVSEKRKIELAQAKNLLFERGIELEEFREGIDFIFNQSGYELNENEVVLSGGGAYIAGIEKLLRRVRKNNLCSPEFSVALGAALKYVMKNPYPAFQFRTISAGELRRVALFTVAGVVVTVASLIAVDRIYSTQNLRDIEKAEFKKVFPNAPALYIREQVKGKVGAGERFELSKRLAEFSKMIESGIKVISFDYSSGTLTVRAEAESSISSKVRAKSVKQTPKGTVEFEVEIR